MIKSLFIPLFLFSSAIALSGCQTLTPNLESLSPANLTSSGKDVHGEVQWDFAAEAGDHVLFQFEDAAGVMESQDLVPAPGAKHVPIAFSLSKNEMTRCRSGGSCRYSAQLKRGEVIKAHAQIYYSPSAQPLLLLDTPQLAGANLPSGKAVSTDNLIGPETDALPKPVYQ